MTPDTEDKRQEAPPRRSTEVFLTLRTPAEVDEEDDSLIYTTGPATDQEPEDRSRTAAANPA